MHTLSPPPPTTTHTPMHNAMHRPMHSRACPSSQTPIRPLLTYRHRDYMILLLHTSTSKIQCSLCVLFYCNVSFFLFPESHKQTTISQVKQGLFEIKKKLKSSVEHTLKTNYITSGFIFALTTFNSLSYIVKRISLLTIFFIS